MGEVVYEGSPTPESGGFRAWWGWRAPPGSTGHVASYTGGEIHKTMRQALREARRNERRGHHTQITKEGKP